MVTPAGDAGAPPAFGGMALRRGGPRLRRSRPGDHRGTPLVLHRDGLERLIAATEHAERRAIRPWKRGEPAYVHDLNHRLAGILDSQGNLRVMRHDGLGPAHRAPRRQPWSAALPLSTPRGNVTETRSTPRDSES